MIKKCKYCGKPKEMRSNQLYCDAKCKKSYENSQRGDGNPDFSKPHSLIPTSALIRPMHLDGEAAEYWNKVAPILIDRGHLNAISEDIFVELCDLVRRLRDINKTINKTREAQTLIQDDDRKQSKESALSDIKRKYSKLLLDYSRQFYLTPLSNRGNFGMPEKETDPANDFIKACSN